MKLEIKLEDVSETAFLTLMCHVLDARSCNPYLNDLGAIRTMDILKTHLIAQDGSLPKNCFYKQIYT